MKLTHKQKRAFWQRVKPLDEHHWEWQGLTINGEPVYTWRGDHYPVRLFCDQVGLDWAKYGAKPVKTNKYKVEKNEDLGQDEPEGHTGHAARGTSQEQE